MPSLTVRGANQLRAVGADLRRAGAPGRGIRSKMRRNLVAAALPVKLAAQRAALEIPTSGTGHTGLRQALAKATQIRVVTGGKNVVVRVWVNPARMPAGQQSLPGLMEGLGKWRHPVFGTDTWVDQASHPYFQHATEVAGIKAAQKAAIAAVQATAAEIERGI
jgi:hypothetical protein